MFVDGLGHREIQFLPDFFLTLINAIDNLAAVRDINEVDTLTGVFGLNRVYVSQCDELQNVVMVTTVAEVSWEGVPERHF
ncbi:hypothetical protein BRC97_04580 [Halobacteriales archaeon QS_6_71_20]|nr:MAG: hypothetical protein BRC97_04580 [Halobacteriales archaeon QS_6_71_20]